MKANNIILNIPSDLEYVWVTHLPNFTIERFEVDKVVHDKKGDILIKLNNSNIWGNTIRAKYNPNGKKPQWVIKKSYHLTELDAALRLRDYYRGLNAKYVDKTTKRVYADAKDKDLTARNIEKFVEKYPEMTI